MDFCASCMEKPGDRERDNMHHLTTHALLQLRKAEQWKLQYVSHKEAYDLLRKLRDEGMIKGSYSPSSYDSNIRTL